MFIQCRHYEIFYGGSQEKKKRAGFGIFYDA